MGDTVVYHEVFIISVLDPKCDGQVHREISKVTIKKQRSSDRQKKVWCYLTFQRGKVTSLRSHSCEDQN